MSEAKKNLRPVRPSGAGGREPIEILHSYLVQNDRFDTFYDSIMIINLKCIFGILIRYPDRE